MFGKSKEDQDVETGAQRSTATPGETSSISSGLSIVGKIVSHGAVTIFGHVESELQASTVVIAEGAEVEGDIVAEELTVSGRVEGTVRANRVKLNSTAVVDGDILHRSLVMEENAQFDGASRRLEDVINTSSRVQTNRTSLRPRQSTARLEPTDRNRRFDRRQTNSLSLSEDASGGSSVATYLGFLVPGVVMTPIGVLSSPAAMAARMRSQNAASMLK